MLSVGELSTATRVLREWRKENYKKDPISEQLYREEFARNKTSADCQTHPNIVEYLRDETAWQRDEIEYNRLASVRPHTNHRPSPVSSPFTQAPKPSHAQSQPHLAVAHPQQQGNGIGAPSPRGEAQETQPHEVSTTTTATTATKTRTAVGLDSQDNGREEEEHEEIVHEEEISEEESDLDENDDQSQAEGEERARSIFKRESIPPLWAEGQPGDAMSTLSLALAARRKRETAMELLIYLCCSTGVSSGGPWPPIRIRVPESRGVPLQSTSPAHPPLHNADATVDRVLEAVRKKSVEEAIPLYLDTGAYGLRIAEDDGTPDSDAPQLHSEVEVKRFGKRFCIVDNPTFKPITLTTHRLVKIALGDDQFQTFEVRDRELKIKDILWRVCSKSLMDYTQHGLHMINSDEPLPLDMSIADVQSTNLVLVRKSKNRSNSNPKPSALGRPKSRLGVSSRKQQKPTLFRSHSNMLEHINWSDDEGEEEAPSDPSQAKLTYTFWSDTVAFRHKRYEVSRMSKFGIKQERYIGIDRDRITNTSKKKGAEQGGGLQAWKEIKNVVDAAVSESKPCQFVLVFKEDGKDQNEAHTFEAQNAQEACEIVEKVKYCKNNTIHL